MSKKSIQDLAREGEALLVEARALAAAKQSTEIKNTLARVKASADELAHSRKAAAFVEYETSRQYIESLKQDIASVGVVATNTFNGSKATLKDLGNGTFKTFDVLKAGGTVEISNTTYLIKDFRHDFAGSTAELLPLKSMFELQGQKSTPFSGVACNFNASTGRLILPLFSKLKSDDVIVLGGISYTPSHVYATSKHFAEYQLEALS